MKNPRVALLLDGSRAFDAGVLKGISRYVNLHRPWQLYRPASTPYQRFSGLADVSVKTLQELNPDGAVMHESPLTKYLLRSGVPTIVIPVSHQVSSGNYLVNDNEEVGKMAAEHLAGLGLKHFGFIGFEKTDWSQVRQEGFRRFLYSKGYDVNEHLLPLSPKGEDRTHNQGLLTRWIKSLPTPIGIFAGNDDLARPVVEVCQQNGLSIPDTIAIVGVDNDELICELSNPPLSSIPFATVKAGYETAELLDALMQGKRPESTTITAATLEVVVRRSTDVLAVEDPDVRDALRFIRENAGQIIQVSDVVNVTSLSQRTLHNRFKAALGRSVMKEINLQRANYIAALLTETTQSLSQISRKLGYLDDAHLVRFFKREMGESPGAYRRHRT